MSWYSSMYGHFLALCLFLWMYILRGTASVLRVFDISGPLMELPVTTPIASVSCLVIAKVHIQRFFVKPAAKLYNAIDNFIFQSYGYIVWNSPRYIARIKSLSQHIRNIALKYMCAARVPPAHQRPSLRHPGSTLGFLPTITTRDSMWIEWDAQTPPEESNEWSFYVRGCGDRPGISITQSAWKSYQAYLQQLGLSPVDSPSRITVKDFEAYQAAIAMSEQTIPVISASDMPSSLTSLDMNGTTKLPDTLVSSLSSSNTLLSSMSSTNTLFRSPENFAPYARLDLKDLNVEEVDISDVLFKKDVTTFSDVVEDLDGYSYPTSHITPRKGDFNMRSIDSFGDIEALFADRPGTPIPDIDGLWARSSACSVPRHSITASLSIYSQESAGSEKASLVDTPPLDAIYRNAVVESVYEDDCSEATTSVAASDSYCQDYFMAAASKDTDCSEKCIKVTILDFNTPSIQSFTDSQADSLCDEANSDLILAEASAKWSVVCCPVETVLSTDNHPISLVNAGDSSLLSSGRSLPQDTVAFKDIFSNALELNISSVNSSPLSSHEFSGGMSCTSFELDDPSVLFPIVSSPSIDAFASNILNQIRRGQNTIDLESDQATGAQSRRFGFHGMHPSTMRLVDVHEYPDPQAVKEQLQTGTKPSPRTAINVHPYRPVKSQGTHPHQHLSTLELEWPSPDPAPRTPNVSRNATLSALEYIERRNVRVSYFAQRDNQQGYNVSSSFTLNLPVSPTSTPSFSCYHYRQDIPF